MGQASAPLASRVAIVTGAAQGIGEAISRAMAQEGATVLLAGLQEEPAHDVARAMGAEGANASVKFVDVADPGSANRMVATCLERRHEENVLMHLSVRGGK